jgi:hypothetical protein
VPGVTTCNTCGAGKYSPAVGATTVGVCTDCAAQTFQDMPAAAMCAACPAGFFQPATGAASCLERNSRRCWKAKDLKNPAAFAPQTGLAITDAISSTPVDLSKPALFCSPAGLGAHGVADPDPRQCCYKAKGTKLATPYNLQVTGAQFGTLQLSLSQPSLVCEQCAGAPLESSLQCWKVKDLKNPAFTKTAGLAVTDGLASDTVDTVKPALFCFAAGLGGLPVSDSGATQCCYKVKGTKLASAVTETVSGTVGGALDLGVQSPSMVCEPCSYTPLP